MPSIKINKWFYLFALVLAITFFFQSFYSIRGKSITVDEGYHFLCGATVLSRGDFRFNVAHPYLAHIFLVAPVYYFTNLKVPDGHSAGWINKDADSFSKELISLNGGNIFFTNKYLFFARTTNVIYTTLFLLVFIIFCGKVFGKTVGLVAGATLVFSPTVVAHAHFVTNDIFVSAMSFTATAFLYLFMTNSKTKRVKYYALFIFFSLAALITKQSSIIIVTGLLIFLFVFRVLSNKNKKSVAIWIKALGEVVAILVTLIFLIWASFKFDYFYYLEAIKIIIINKYQIGHESFFFGRWKNLGWFYHPMAILIKEPIAFLLLFFIGAVIAVRKITTARPFLRFFPKMVFIFIPLFFATVAFSSHTKIGIRHVLPLYPFMAITAGFGATWLINKSKMGLYFSIFLFLWLIYASASIYPFYLTYFNELIGGATNGYKYLQDSNLDWDQNELITDKYVNEHSDVIYPGEANIVFGQKYLIRLSRVFGKPSDRITQAQSFIDAMQIGKLKILKNIGNTHWIVVIENK